MECLSENDLLQFNSNTLEAVRKLRGFNSQREVNDAVNILETWAKTQDHFLKKNFDRGYLERVIMSCKGSLERSKKQIDKLCTVRNLPAYKIYFEDFDVKENLGEIFDPSMCAAVSFVPKLTKDHDRIILFRHYVKKFTFDIQQKVFKLAALVAHFLKYNDYCNSYIIILDYTYADIPSIITNFSIPEFIKAVEGILQSYGMRLKEIHIICSSSLLEALIKIAKLGLPENLYNRLHTHRKYEALQDYVPLELLPKDFGGQKELLYKQFVRVVDLVSSEEFRKHRKEMNSMRSDESKRRTDTFNEQYMGMPGTFRTLSVD